MSLLRHGAALNRLCAGRMVSGEDIISGEMDGERSVKDTKMIKNRFLEIPRNNIWSAMNVDKVPQEKKLKCDKEFFRKSSLLLWPSFLEKFLKSHRVQSVKSYSVFTFEPLRKLHLRILELPKK